MDPATKKAKFIELQQLSKEICEACREHDKETVAQKYAERKEKVKEFKELNKTMKKRNK
jgi:hypothetical protein